MKKKAKKIYKRNRFLFIILLFILISSYSCSYVQVSFLEQPQTNNNTTNNTIFFMLSPLKYIKKDRNYSI